MAHPELDQLLNFALEFAQKMLKEHGEFYPFGASMGMDGKISMDGAGGRDRLSGVPTLAATPPKEDGSPRTVDGNREGCGFAPD